MIDGPSFGERLSPEYWWALAGLGVLGMVAAAFVAVAALGGSDSKTESEDVAGLATTTPALESATTIAASLETVPDKSAPVTIEPAETEPSETLAESESTATQAVPVDCPPLFRIRFKVNDADPDPESVEPYVADLVTWLSNHADTQLLLEGHADSAGSEQENLALSFRRAESAVSVFIAAGVPATQLVARGFGEYQGLIGEASDSELNRRVSLRVPGYEACEIGDAESSN